MERSNGRIMNTMIAISGRGSNMKALLNNGINVDIVLSNSKCAPGLEYARKRGIKCVVCDTIPDICHTIEDISPDLICLAGFMRLLPKSITEKFLIMNIHPSLLPRFPGLRAQKQALESGAKYSGCTVHMVDGGIDTGKIILQRIVPIKPTDMTETLADRILEQEHIAYAQAVKIFMEYNKNDRTKIVAKKHHDYHEFKDSYDAIKFALASNNVSNCPQAKYIWNNRSHTIVSSSPPELIPHIASTPDDDFEILQRRLDNLVNWHNTLPITV